MNGFFHKMFHALSEHSFNIDIHEMIKFIGLILLSGYNTRLSETGYWSTNPDIDDTVKE